MRKTIWLAILISSFPLMVFAQAITNVSVQAKGNIVTIFYDLEGNMENQLFEVAIYSSHNNKEEPLKFVRGEVGRHIKPGKDKQIEWGVKKELKEYTGEISFEIRAILIFSPLAIQLPPGDTIFKRGRSYSVQWKGGVAGEPLALELFQHGAKKKVITQVQNAGSYTWSIPKETKPGKNFSLKLYSTNQSYNFSFSHQLIIKRKIPTIVKILPLGIVTGAAAILLTRKAPAPEPINQVKSKLPVPPDPE